MEDLLKQQKAAFLREGTVSADIRIDRIDRAIDLLEKHAPRLCEALMEDFGNRCAQQSRQIDIDGSILPLMHAKERLREWMSPEDCQTMFNFHDLGARATIYYQPRGVVGCISPWNVPVQLVFGPLAGIFSAGNRVMIKPSEYTPVTSELMKELFAENYDPDEAAVITGGAEVGEIFSSLPFDHLLFTGSASVGKRIMRAASENLVPITLELGGKSPVLVSRSADIKKAAEKVMAGKAINAGQVCLSPDYVFVHVDCIEDFITAAVAAVRSMYPTVLDNPDYTSIINKRHFDRITGYVRDASQKGAKVIEINPADENFDRQKYFRIPPTLVLHPTDEMHIMQEEIFGPVLPIKSYSAMDDAIAYINMRARPLALYYFGEDDEELARVLGRTVSGGVTVNDVMMHSSQEDLPFGGIGLSGMGSYHGRHGFRTFSHAKAVYTQSDAVSDIMRTMRPPYGN